MSALLKSPLLSIEPKTWARIEAKLATMNAEDIKVAFDLWNSQDDTKHSTVPVRNLGNGTCIVDLVGTVSRTGPDFCDMVFGETGFSTLDLVAVAGQIKRDPLISTVVLNWHSPGGTVEGTSAAGDAIMSLRQSGKKVISYAEELMASAAYWIGSQADEIYVGPTADIGSIGVFCVVPDYSKLYDTLGIKINIVKSAPGKAAGVPGSSISQEDLKDFQTGVNEVHDLFTKAVATGRNMKVRYARNASGLVAVPDDGRTYMGQAAVDVGLADGIKNLDQILESIQASARPTMRMERSSQGEKKTMKILAKTLGLAEDATEEQIATALTAKLTDVADVNSKIDARVAERSELAIAKFRKDMKADELLKSLKSKVTGAQEASARKLIEANAEAFEDFMANMPVVVPMAGAGQVVDVTGKVEGLVGTADSASIDLGDPDDRDKLHNAAKALQASTPTLTYDQATERVMAGKKILRNGLPV